MTTKNDTKAAPEKGKQKTEVVQPLRVEIRFPLINDLKQALAFDSDGNLIITVQFKAAVNQFEIFRLANLLKQPHSSLYAIVGTAQSAMDFKFDLKEEKVEIIKAAAQLPAPAKDKPTGKPQDNPQGDQAEPKAVKIHDVSFNHIPEDARPFGVAVDFVVEDSGEIKTVAGRGMNPTEAAIEGAKNCGAVPQDVKEPFEAMAALEKLEPSAPCYKLIRAIEVGSFDIEEPVPSNEGGKKKNAKTTTKGD